MEANIVGIHLHVHLAVTVLPTFRPLANNIPSTEVPPLQPIHWLLKRLNSEYVTSWQWTLWEKAFQLVFKQIYWSE